MDDDEINTYCVLRADELDATRHVLGSVKQLLLEVDADLMHIHIKLLEKGPELGEEEVAKLWYKIHELWIEIDKLQEDKRGILHITAQQLKEELQKHTSKKV